MYNGVACCQAKKGGANTDWPTLPARREPFARDAWILIGGQNASIVGENMLLVVLPLTVLGMTGSALQVSVVFILIQLPAFVGVLAGAARRRLSPRRLLVACSSGRLLCLLAVTGLLAVDVRHVFAAYPLFFVVSAFTVLFRATRIEFITHLVPAHSLQRFNSYDRTVEAMAAAAGLGIGAYAYQYLPLPSVFLAIASTFLVSAASLLFIGAGLTGTPAAARSPAGLSFKAAAAALGRRPVTAFLLSGETLTGAAFGCYGAMFVVYARTYLRVDSAMFGNFEMVQMLSATVAGICIAGGVLRLSLRATVLSGYLGMGLSMAALGLNTLVWPVFPLMVTLGFTNMMYAVSVRTLLQTHCRRQELIHVFALESILFRAAQIAAAAAAGALLSFAILWVNWTLVAAGMIVLAIAAWGSTVPLAPARQASREASAHGS